MRPLSGGGARPAPRLAAPASPTCLRERPRALRPTCLPPPLQVRSISSALATQKSMLALSPVVEQTVSEKVSSDIYLSSPRAGRVRREDVAFLNSNDRRQCDELAANVSHPNHAPLPL